MTEFLVLLVALLAVCLAWYAFFSPAAMFPAMIPTIENIRISNQVSDLRAVLVIVFFSDMVVPNCA